MSSTAENPDYRMSHLPADKAARYERSFSEDPWRAYLWRGEQDALDRILRKHFPNGVAAHLDFACGTGRVLSFLRRRVGLSVGLDCSAAMLALAAANAPTARLVLADITQHDVLGREMFDLITVFRFLANAQDELRLAALRKLADHLSPGGLLIFNNHKNHTSLLHRLGRLMRKRTRTLSHRHVRQLLPRAGLEIIDEFPLGILPATDGHLLLPACAHRALDAALARGSLGRRLAQDVIYVCAAGGQSGTGACRPSGGPA